MERYHPRRARNEILSDDERLALLRGGDHVTLALCADDEPYVVTLSYGLDEANRRLYFHCANEGDKLVFIRRNGRARATLIKDNGYLETRCDHDYESLVIRGRISVVDDLDEKKRAPRVLLEHLEYLERDPEPIFEHAIKDDRSYDGVTILRLDMDSIVGKNYVG